MEEKQRSGVILLCLWIFLVLVGVVFGAIFFSKTVPSSEALVPKAELFCGYIDSNYVDTIDFGDGAIQVVCNIQGKNYAFGMK